MAEGDPTNTKFEFSHRIFSLEGCYFSIGRQREASFTLPMGEHMVSVELGRVAQEFGIDPESADGAMLGKVRKALKIVKVIKPGDNMPNELLDGTASWNFDPKLRQQTKDWIVNAITTWFDASGYAAVEEDEDDSKEGMLTAAYRALAADVRLDIPEPQKRVAQMVERLSDELTYIEAIGERLALISRIRANVRKLMDRVRQDAEFGQELLRIDDLIAEPLKKLSSQIKNARRRTFDVKASFSNVEEHIGYLRGQRDQMRYELLDWDELLNEWTEVWEDDDAPVPIELCHKTYRLLAELYSTGQTWAAIG